jgi:putative tricarboxylic transport membrane protein
MDNYFVMALAEILNLQTIILIIIGTVFGIITGAIPGFSIPMAILIAFPFTFTMGPINGIAVMTAIMVGGFSGGLISSVMIGIPGTPSSIATTFDGYPMNKNGEPGRALGIGVLSSFVGTLISLIILVFLGPLVAKFSLKFGPWEVVSFMLLAFTLVAGLSKGAMIKGIIGTLLGLLIATVGIDFNANPRFTFGIDMLSDGFSVIAVLIGVFAFSLMMDNVQNLKEHQETQAKLRQVNTKLKIPYIIIIKDMWKQKWNLIRSSIVGAFIGALPGAGGEVSNFITYEQAKQLSKHPEKFGTGIPDGIAAAESSNSATIGGGFIPTLTMGIPGDSLMAILMGVMVLHGITPGPRLFQEQPVLIGSIYGTMLLASIAMVVAQFFMIRFFTRISNVPQAILIPIVLVLCIVGSYGLNFSMYDIWVFLIFGVLGYLLFKIGVPLSPMILGLILGDLLENEIFHALSLDPKWTTFFTRPISAILLIIGIVSLAISIWQLMKSSKKTDKDKDTRSLS